MLSTSISKLEVDSSKVTILQHRIVFNVNSTHYASHLLPRASQQLPKANQLCSTGLVSCIPGLVNCSLRFISSSLGSQLLPRDIVSSSASFYVLENIGSVYPDRFMIVIGHSLLY
jgi:hypothetical protein